MSEHRLDGRENLAVAANTVLLRAENVSLRRDSGTGRRVILDKVNLSIGGGQIIHLQGPSGTGKSTLLWALARMLPLDEGALFFEGRPASEWTAPTWRTLMALVVQTHSMVPGTVADNLLLPWTLKIRNRPESGADVSRPHNDRLRRELDALLLHEVSLETDASQLSVGQAARISIVRTLLTAPRCLLLDEPCAALDGDASDRVMARIADFTTDDRAALIVGHGALDRVGRVARVGRVLRLDSGKLTEEGR